MTAPRPRPRHALAESEVSDPPVEAAPAPVCNLPSCPAAPEWRGLCAAHRQTHRGLADPKEPR